MIVFDYERVIFVFLLFVFFAAFFFFLISCFFTNFLSFSRKEQIRAICFENSHM